MINTLLRWLTQGLLWLRYRIEVRGLDEIARRGTRGVLFLPNHPALIDPIIVLSRLMKRFAPRALADEDQVDRFFIRRLARRIGAIPVPDLAAQGPAAREAVGRAIDRCAEVLHGGGNLLLYPSGHAYHSRYEDLRGNSAVQRLLQAAPDVRVVLVRDTGLWGSRFSRAWGTEPDVGRVVRRTPWLLLLNGLFFMPRRRVTLEFVEPDDLPRDASRNEINGYLESFYNADAPPARHVPTFWWKGSTPREMPEPQQARIGGDPEAVGESTRQIVFDHLRAVSGVERIDNASHLAADLGLDSLARADLLVWLQQEFGYAGADVETLQTAGDVALAASGQGVSRGLTELAPVPGKWFPTGNDRRLHVGEGDTLCRLFLDQAGRGMGRPVIADQRSGVKTYRDLITAVFALKDRIAALEGEAVGIMLPASVGAATLYLATLFTGKTPVLVNWTVGVRNIRHGLQLAGVRKVLTAQALLDRLASQGVDLSEIADVFVPVEQIGRSLSKIDKLKAALSARLRWKRLYDCRPSDTAAVLFTSGSETLPKAVPLSQSNIITNLGDALEAFTVNASDRIVGFLPPFHSFGLTVTVCLPLCTSLAAVYHPDPTQSATIARIIEAYRATIVVGTPTFLGGIIRDRGSASLESLRLAVTGAERCPDRIYHALKAACPNAVVLEGYGITECSPIVAVNDEKAPQRGTIGKTLRSLEWILVDPETLEPVEPGRQGMLLVRGPSVFGGYLGEAPDPFVEVQGRRWYRTGDLLTADAEGVLTFKGRYKRFVKIGGEMISLPAIEAVLEEQLRDDSDEGPVLAVEAAGDEQNVELVLFAIRDVTREQANAWIRAAGLSGLHSIRRVERLDELPLLGTGKVDYRTLKGRLAQ